MENKYLWDKTGNSQEIEELESSLQVFRFQENVTPEISAKILPLKKEPKRQFFPVFNAIAAAFIFTFFFGVIWFAFSKSQIETTKIDLDDKSNQNEISINQKSVAFAVPEKTLINEIPKIEKANNIEATEPKTNKRTLNNQKLIYKPKAKSSKTTNRNSVVKFTHEEKEAYQQLMLALSITSSKLKIVKDKVQNLDEQTAIYTEKNPNTKEK